MREWMPIESAPKDNEPVLVCGDPRDTASYPTVYIAFRTDATKAIYWRMNGDEGYECRPTHWMPLPEPPK